MKVTVCEMPNSPASFGDAWRELCDHVAQRQSDIVLLPELPFYRWLAATKNENDQEWIASVKAHDEWISRLDELSPAIVVSTRPTFSNGVRQNTGIVWDRKAGPFAVHTKYYLPAEPGFWEATWYKPGSKKFEGFETSKGKIGFQICTELWFGQHARQYGKQGVQMLVCPRATPHSTAKKSVPAGQAAAVDSGAFCHSSYHPWESDDGSDYSGVGWIIEPEEGKILGLTSSDHPFLTLDVDLSEADKAKTTYPRYVLD